MDFKEISKKELQFFWGVPFSDPIENVEIYFSKIDIKIFESETILLVQNRFILTK